MSLNNFNCGVHKSRRIKTTFDLLLNESAVNKEYQKLASMLQIGSRQILVTRKPKKHIDFPETIERNSTESCIEPDIHDNDIIMGFIGFRRSIEFIEIGAVAAEFDHQRIVVPIHKFHAKLHPVRGSISANVTNNATPSLAQVLNNIDRWASELKVCLWGSWGDYYPNTVKDASNHALLNSSLFTLPHIDMQSLFELDVKNRTGKQKTFSFEEALIETEIDFYTDHLGYTTVVGRGYRTTKTEFETKHHPSLNDANNIIRMLKEVDSFRITTHSAAKEALKAKRY